jgi:[ribosomal protein S18]-alanine N-acetyltransferase
MNQPDSPSGASQPRFREMTEKDIPIVHAIERLSFQSAWTKGMFRDELRRKPETHYLVAETEDDRDRTRIVAYGGVWFVVDECHVVNIAVHPQFRGKRIGAHCLLRLIDIGLERGKKRFTLEVRAGNHAAIRMYEKFGFISVALRRGYYKEENEDAVIMWIHDASDKSLQYRLQALRKELNPEHAGDGN